MRKLLFIFLAFTAIAARAQQDSLVWSDEFNGTGVPDPTKWGYDLGAGGWGNNEIQTYTNLYVNSHQESGNLIIEALKQGTTWTSARLLSRYKYDFTYGRIVFRAKLPAGIGTWPALWLLGSNLSTKGWPGCGEIDVMEHVGKHPNWVHSSLHSPSSYGNTVNTKSKLIDSVSTTFHTYMMTWTPEKIVFSIDSVDYYTYQPSVRNASTWPFDKPFFIIMNIAMGGNWGSEPIYETGGLKNGIEPTLTSARMVIDYVRVYRQKSYSNGIGEQPGGIKKKDRLLISPNPGDGKFKLTIPAGTNATGEILDGTGRCVKKFTLDNPETSFDLSDLPRGLYCIRTRSEGEYMTTKLILK